MAGAAGGFLDSPRNRRYSAGVLYFRFRVAVARYNTLSFDVLADEQTGLKELRPKVDGTDFAELVEGFELASKHEPAGGYGGIIPEIYNYGNLRDYWLGVFPDGSCRSDNGGQYILGCECGEVGCWPLIGSIEVQGDEVIWSCFSQPFRPNRDYTGLGPFRFLLTAYTQAIDKGLAQLS